MEQEDDPAAQNVKLELSSTEEARVDETGEVAFKQIEIDI